MAKKKHLMVFDIDSPMGGFSAIVVVSPGMTSRDARADAYSLIMAELGRHVRITGEGRRIAKLPTDAWESRHAAGWGWVAKAK